MVLFGSLLDQFVSSFVRAYALNIRIRCRLFIDFSTRILINIFNGLETFFLSLIHKNPRSKFMLELMVIIVSIQNFETRCSNSAASLVRRRARRYCSNSVASFEDQVGQNAGYDRIFGAIGLAVLSGLGRRHTHPGHQIHLPFRGL